MEVSASHHGRFTPGEKASGIRWVSGCVGLKAGMDAVEQLPYPCQESKLDSSAVQFKV
jgi:hypothetical protein